MRKSSQQKFGQSLSIAVVFASIVVLFVLVGVSVKLAILFMASSFDGTHQYILGVNDKNDPSSLLIFSPQNHSVTFLIVHHSLSMSGHNSVDVPIDASVNTTYSSNIPKLAQNILVNASLKENLTMLDAARLFLFVNTLQQSDFHYHEITLPISAVDREKLFSSIFFDSSIYTDNENVTVMNATGESGIGSKVAHMLTTVGVNVISVTTSDSTIESSTLAALHSQSYTAIRIGKFFRIHPIGSTNHQTISNITITIGKDRLKELE